MHGRVLVCAGSDCSGGAGAQADIKTITALGGYAMTAITALTAQNTLGVFDIHEVPPAFIARQMSLCLEDIGADVIKTGMLATAAVIETIGAVLDARAPALPLVVDPVMVAKGGAALLTPQALKALGASLLSRATLITPNLPEAETLLGGNVSLDTLKATETAARRLLELTPEGPRAVLLKGGHRRGETVMDILATRSGTVTVFSHPRIESPHTHGTGCTLAAAIACGLAQGMTLETAIVRARVYVHTAIATAPAFGHGHGPLNHAHTVREDVSRMARPE
ncbi:MAG: hydroxymethylpyrimidine/phosphomethylpyrimidine kinase [Rhodospirillaceae bacterium]|nr:MAG: hydroxymethylpyrimidine/phosphomethylpyrimidine kinase [Rhodospirillaceae bacterium]